MEEINIQITAYKTSSLGRNTVCILDKNTLEVAYMSEQLFNDLCTVIRQSMEEED